MDDQEAWDAKVEEIVALIGRDLFGKGPLTDEQRAEVRDVTDDAIDEWASVGSHQINALKAMTPLQLLLAEQHELAERILDAQDANLFKDGDTGDDE